MTAAGELSRSADLDPFDEIDRIEASTAPTAADLDRLDELCRHQDSLVSMSARQVRAALGRAAPVSTAVEAPASVEGAGPKPAETPARAEADPVIAPEPAPAALPASLHGPITLSTTVVVDDVKGIAEAMANGKFVSYLRVSTAKQGASGLGLDAQRRAVTEFLAGGRGPLVREFVEIESGKRVDRPKLAEALALCRLHAATLVIAKLDRLSRDAHFLLGLEKAGVDFIAADMPTANRLTVGIMAMVADEERRAISKRTKEALAAKARWYAGLDDEQRDKLRAQGRPIQLGGDKGKLAAVRAQGTAAGVAVRQERAAARAADIAPMIAELRAEGVTSLAKLAAVLTERGIPTSRGAERWSPTQVSRVLKATTCAP